MTSTKTDKSRLRSCFVILNILLSYVYMPNIDV